MRPSRAREMERSSKGREVGRRSARAHSFVLPCTDLVLLLFEPQSELSRFEAVTRDMWQKKGIDQLVKKEGAKGKGKRREGRDEAHK